MISDSEPTPVELFAGRSCKRDLSLRTTHEEADLIMVHQVLRKADDGAQSIKVISDDTEVFVILVRFCSEKEVECRLIMEATSSERMSFDIKATVQSCKTLVPYLLVAKRSHRM